MTVCDFPQLLRDLVQLTKPRISLLCLLMFSGGFGYSVAFSGQDLFLFEWLGADFFLGLFGTWCSVAAANALNMAWEKESDKLMMRTALRPLPSGRMRLCTAVSFGIALAVISTILLLLVNGVTAILGLVALLGYVFVYTPLKRVTPHALIIGAIPGAMPPLMGWTAHWGQIHTVGLLLFGILVFWQVPHFVAIAITHKRDYKKAGIKVLPVVRGEKRAIKEALVYSVILLLTSLLLIPFANAGVVYGLTAFLLGMWMIVLCWQGLRRMSSSWSRRTFLASLVYLPVLTAALLVEVLILDQAEARSVHRIEVESP